MSKLGRLESELIDSDAAAGNKVPGFCEGIDVAIREERGPTLEHVQLTAWGAVWDPGDVSRTALRAIDSRLCPKTRPS